MKLYEIAREYESILNEAIDVETGEVNEVIIHKLDEVKVDVKEKAIAVASYIKNLEAERDAINAAKKLMAEREAKLDKEADWLTDYLQINMERCGIKEISCAYFGIKLKKCPVSVNIINEGSLPGEYIKSKIVTSVDKAKIREELINGVIVPGAELKQNIRLEIR